MATGQQPGFGGRTLAPLPPQVQLAATEAFAAANGGAAAPTQLAALQALEPTLTLALTLALALARARALTLTLTLTLALARARALTLALALALALTHLRDEQRAGVRGGVGVQVVDQLEQHVLAPAAVELDEPG